MLRDEMWGTPDARLGCTKRRAVQLCELEARVPKDHALRPIRQIVDEALAALSPEFKKLYAKFGRPSIPPERLLRALLLQAFYSVRSELQLTEQLDYNLLFRWFVGLSLDEAIWDQTVFTKNRSA
jgi:transposase